MSPRLTAQGRVWGMAGHGTSTLLAAWRRIVQAPPGRYPERRRKITGVCGFAAADCKPDRAPGVRPERWRRRKGPAALAAGPVFQRMPLSSAVLASTGLARTLSLCLVIVSLNEPKPVMVTVPVAEVQVG